MTPRAEMIMDASSPCSSQRRPIFDHPAHFLCAAQEMSESQILNANPLCKNLRQQDITYYKIYDFFFAAAWHEA
jgi:hypothetical protein